MPLPLVQSCLPALQGTEDTLSWEGWDDLHRTIPVATTASAPTSHEFIFITDWLCRFSKMTQAICHE